MSEFRDLTNRERAALRQRTARALQYIWAFQGLPVQVGNPCEECGGLYWWVTGRQPIAPSGYCLNCNPTEIAKRPNLLKLVQESMLDFEEEAAPEATPVPEPGPNGQLSLF